ASHGARFGIDQSRHSLGFSPALEINSLQTKNPTISARQCQHIYVFFAEPTTEGQSIAASSVARPAGIDSIALRPIGSSMYVQSVICLASSCDEATFAYRGLVQAMYVARKPFPNGFFNARFSK